MVGARDRLNPEAVDTVLAKLRQMTPEQVQELKESIGSSITAWCHHFFSHNGSLKVRRAIKKIISKTDAEPVDKRFKIYSNNELIVAVKSAICWTDVCRKLNISVCSFNFKRLQKLCTDNAIDTTHFDTISAFKRNKLEVWTKDTLLIENCSIHRSGLRPVLIRLGLYTGKCAECGISDNWNGKPLTIEIDHINGIHTDNRIENLRWLCPNCHSQTETYRRRKK